MESGELLPHSGPSFTTKPADGRGGWRAALLIITLGFFERIGFIGVSANLIMYLTGPLGMSTAAAAANVNAWGGTVQVLPLVGALAADSRIGRYRALMAACVVYLLSLGMLTASSGLQTPHNHAESSLSPPTTSPAHLALCYIALYLLALAQGFYGPCAEALGADQFVSRRRDGGGGPSATASRSSYFNWYHFTVSWGYAIASAGLSYIEDNVGWTVGFAACWVAMVLGFAVFLLGTRTYHTERPVEGGAFVETVRAWAARVFRRRKDLATGTERLLDSQPKERKGLVAKLFPIWVTSLVYAVIFSQVPTLFTKQSSTLDRRLGAGGVVVPPAALQCFMNVTFIVMLPLYDRVLVPLARRLTGHETGVTMLQRIGASMAVSCVAMVVAALVELKRLGVARDAGLVDQPKASLPMSLWWMVPQYVLLGLAGVLGEIGLMEFFYDQVPDALRSVGLALCLSIFGVGSYASSALVSAIDWATRRNGGESWFSDNLNRGHLDYFYWILAALAALEVAAFLHFANRYAYRNRRPIITQTS